MNGPKMGWDTGWKPGIRNIPAIAPGYKKQTYPKGAVISVGEKLYISNTAIGTPEDFNKDHWDETDMMSCISDAPVVKYVSMNDSYSDIQAIIDRGQFPIMKVVAGQGYFYYYPSFEYNQFVFKCVTDSGIRGLRWNGTAWAAQDNKIPHPSSIAVQYSDQSTYAVGDYCMYGGLLYECTTAVTTEEPFDINKWTRTSVAEQIGNVEALLAAL